MRVFLALPALVIGLSLSACAGSSTESKASDAVAESESTNDGASSAVSAAKFNDADVIFAQNMIPHHQQAVEMADMALVKTRGASAVVTDLASRIRGAQQPEIELMTSWLDSWGKNVAESMEGMDHSSMEAMEGMMSADQMASLESESGEAFDRAWLNMMVEHHKGAVVMAETVIGEGSNPQVRDLAEKIIAAQKAEITEMSSALGS